MDKSSTPSVRDRKAVRLETDWSGERYMRAKKYYYVKMNRGKRHFVPLADSKGKRFLVHIDPGEYVILSTGGPARKSNTALGADDWARIRNRVWILLRFFRNAEEPVRI